MNVSRERAGAEEDKMSDYDQWIPETDRDEDGDGPDAGDAPR